MNNTLSIFKDTELQNKEDLLISLKSLYDQHLCDGTCTTSQTELVGKFIERIESMVFPQCDNWWFYQYDFTRFGMVLEMCHCVNYNIESDGVVAMTIDQSFCLTEITCDMMSVADFARLHNVQPVSVRQWIRRGKLRAIKKQGRDWLIASIAEKPSRHYKSVTYEWPYNNQKLCKLFPYLKGVNTIQISQNIENKALFDILLGGRIRMNIISQEREKLELTLLAMNEIEVDESDLRE